MSGLESALVSVRIAVCNFPPYVHAHDDRTNFYGPWVNAVLDALTDDAAISWLYLQDDRCTQRDMTELLCTDQVDIAIHPMLIGSMDRGCLLWSHPLDSSGLVTVDSAVTSPKALLFAPFSVTTWIMYAVTVVLLIGAMILLDKKGDRRRHVLRGSMAVSGQLDVPENAHVSIYILYVTFGIFTMLILSVYTADLSAYLNSAVDRPATRLKTLVDDQQDFYIMYGAAELQMELDTSPLTAGLHGGYSIVSDPESELMPMLMPYMMSEKVLAKQCGPLRLSYNELPPMPLGFAMREGFAMNARIQRRVRRRVLSGRMQNEMHNWIRAKYACDQNTREAATPTLDVMWPVFLFAYIGITVAVTTKVMPWIAQTMLWPNLANVPRVGVYFRGDRVEPCV